MWVVCDLLCDGVWFVFVPFCVFVWVLLYTVFVCVLCNVLCGVVWVAFVCVVWLRVFYVRCV